MANLLTTAFEGLTPADFQVYDRACWSNNQFNLGRMRAKERMLALAAPLTALPGAEGLELAATREIPGVWNNRAVQDQWVYLVRDAAARAQIAPALAEQSALVSNVRDPAEHHRHGVVYVRLHAEGLEVGFALAAHATVDREHLQAALAADAEAFRAHLSGLPTAFRLDDAAPTGIFEAALAALAAGERTELRIATTISRADAEAAGAQIAEDVAALVAALLPVLRAATWRPESDEIGLLRRVAERQSRLTEAAAVRAQAEAEAERQRAERTAAARDRSNERAEADAAWRRRMAEARAVARAAEPAPEAPPVEKPAPEKPAPVSPQAAPKPAAKPTKAASEATAPKAAPEGPAAAHAGAPVAVAVGDRVRLSRGLLGGKEGVITADSGKGYYKVKVGTLEVQVLGAELVKT